MSGLAVLALAAPAAAQTSPPAAPTASVAPAADAAPVPPAPPTSVGHTSTATVRPFVSFDMGGSFRFRADLFGNPDLGLPVVGTTVGSSIAWGSGVLPPLSESALPSEDTADVIAGANIRLRWEPSVTVGETVTFHAQVDVFDNLVLGSTPDYAPGRPDAPLVFFSEGQASPTSGVNSLTDAVRVKRVWAEFSLFNLLNFDVGRMPHHWGMGMLHHGGDCDDCDYGDSVDRIGVRLDLPIGFYVYFGWDFPGEGAIYADPRDFYGQPYDASQVDDVDQWVLELFDRPITLEEQKQRHEDLHVRRVPVVDWGVYNAFRQERYSSLLLDLPAECRNQTGPVLTDSGLDGRGVSNVQSVGFDCLQLTNRDAFFWIPDAWVRVEWRPSFDERFLFEIELAGVLASDAAQVQADPSVDSSREFWAGAGVLRTEYRKAAWTGGLEVGTATGDDVGFFGVRDRSTSVVPEDELRDRKYAVVRGNQNVTSFVFNRDYHVDLLLFREVIGAVTNTVYTKPWVRWDILGAESIGLAARLDLLYAAAMFEDGTPGRDANLGLEADLKLLLDVGEHFSGVLETGVLVPFGGLDDFVTGAGAEPAWTLQGRMHVRF